VETTRLEAEFSLQSDDEVCGCGSDDDAALALS